MSPQASSTRPPTSRPEVKRRRTPAPRRLMWSSRKASSREAAVNGGLVVFFAILTGPQNRAAEHRLQFYACLRLRLNRPSRRLLYDSSSCSNSQSPSPANPSCRRFSGTAPISPPGSCVSTEPRSPRGCRNPTGRTLRPGPTSRRGNQCHRGRSRAAAPGKGAGARTTPPHGTMRRGR
jgi:hypothetical protein